MRLSRPRPRSGRALRSCSLAILLVIVPRLAASADGRWFQTAPAGENTACVYDPVRDRLLLFGGSEEMSTSNDLWQCPLGVTPAWARIDIGAPRPPARAAHSLVYDSRRDRLIVYGGTNSAGVAIADVWVLPLGVEPLAWEELTPGGGTPAARYYHTAVYDSLQDRMVVVGGSPQLVQDGPPTEFLDDVWMLSLSGSPQWSGPSTAGLGLRCGQVAIYDPSRTRMVLFGGFDGTMKNDTWAMSLAASPPYTWTEISTAGTPPGPRAGTAWAYDRGQDRLLLFGGVGDALNSVNETWQLELSTSTWQELTPAGGPPSPRMFAAGVCDQPRNRMLVFGSPQNTETSSPTDVFWELSLGATPAWTEVPKPLTPEPRAQHGAVYDAPRNRMIVVGGRDRSSMLIDVWSLSLGSAMQWTQLAPSGIAPELAGGVAICDTLRHRLVTYGGWSGNQVYALTLAGPPEWTRMFPDGTWPPDRYHPSGVYDAAGDRIIVFGGQANGTDVLNDTWVLGLGGSMTWSQLQPHGTPPPGRWGHVAVYDPIGARMIVYGGIASAVNDTLLLGDVWQLSMGDTTWSQLAPEGALPAPRAASTAVFDPGAQRLIVYAGNVAPPQWGTNETWSLNLAGTPAWHAFDFGTEGTGSARAWHSAVFDPRRGRMIVFGGWLNASTAILTVPVPVPPAVAVSLLDASAAAGRVQVRWQLGAADHGVVVYRRAEASEWQAAGVLQADARRVVTFVDQDITAGFRYGYCLGMRTAAGEIRAGEVWVEVPGTSRFALHGCRPNPAREWPMVAFSLAGTARARLELLDVAGRRVLARDVGGLGAGEHVLHLGSPAPLPAGVYLVRLTQGTRVQTAKVTILW